MQDTRYNYANNSLENIELEEEDLFDYSYDFPGSLPGTLRIDPGAEPLKISLIDYDPIKASRFSNISPEACALYLETESVSWFDIAGLGNESKWQEVARVFNLHPLLLEDVVNVPQRPKVEDYGDMLLIITQMVLPKKDNNSFCIEQVSLVLGKNYLLTIQEESAKDCFDSIRDRIRGCRGAIRHRGVDYLAYALWDAIIDGYFPVLEACQDRIEDIEEVILTNPTRNILTDIYRIKRELLALRRSIWPQRNALHTVIRDEHPLISKEVQVYLRDCYDHIVEIIDIIEVYRELVSSLLDVYVSAMGNKLNEIMKLLTVISTVFIPLTFIAGVYGMNFEYMPELQWHYGYFICLSCMLFLGGTLIYFFWKRGWFKNVSKLEVH